jgi:charged multivesicular body protein 3
MNISFQLDVATKQARQAVKQHAARGDVKSARILAREVVRSDKQKDRLSVSKARLGSIGTQLTQQMGEWPRTVLALRSAALQP